MKQLIVLSTAMLFTFASCQNESAAPNEFFNQDNLPSQFFTINNAENTKLRSKSGVLIKIEKNSFETKEAIEIEFKEALTMEDIVLGGLTTMANNGQPLASSGMTFIQAKTASGVDLELKEGKTIEITVPETGVRVDNKIFEGIEHGGILWVEKEPVKAEAQLNDIEKGQALFNGNCASCHNRNMARDMTGPALGNITKYRDWNWIKSFTRNSQQLIASGDVQAICLYNEYNKSVMPGFPDLTDKELEQLYAYIENTAILNNVPIDSSLFGSEDCGSTDMRIIGWGDTTETGDRSSILSTTFKTTLNWANIDRFWDDPRMKPQEFFVEVTEEHLEDINVFIVFRDDKCFLPSWWNDGNKYSFTHNSDEKMTTLPIGATAQIMVTAKKGDAVYFAVKEIIYGDESLVKMTPKEISKEKMLEEIKRVF
jgi:mono/diheme cytochrome c family protein